MSYCEACGQATVKKTTWIVPVHIQPEKGGETVMEVEAEAETDLKAMYAAIECAKAEAKRDGRYTVNVNHIRAKGGGG